jgi:hypothetical protein
VSKSLIALAACTWIAFLPTARADETPSQTPDAAGLFKQLDANGDGQLVTDEIPDDRKSLFERLLRKGDKNGDGKLAAEEFTAALAGGRGDERPSGPTATSDPAPASSSRGSTPTAMARSN